MSETRGHWSVAKSAGRVTIRYWFLIAFACLGGVMLGDHLKDLSQKSMDSKSDDQHPIEVSVDYVFGNYYDLKVSSYRIFAEKKVADGGGLAVVDESRVLLTTGDGASYIVGLDEASIQLEPIAIEPPLDVDSYRKHNPNAASKWYRVTDILLEKGQGSEHLLYVAATHWDRERDCYTLRLSEAKINLDNTATANWAVRYRTDPCLKTRLKNETGGRMAFLDNGSILVSVGNFGVDKRVLKGGPDYPYGKVVELERGEWKTKIFTSGHRNPQGLLVDGGEIWETEHGPHGGDELNLLKYSTDYGWPRESYGTDYGKKTFKYNVLTGDHSRTKRPIYAWIPSIAVSNLVRIHGNAFPA